MSFDSDGSTADNRLGILLDEHGPDYVDEHTRRIAAVSPDDVARVAKAVLDPNNLVVTIVGKSAGHPDPTASQTGE